MTVSRGTEKLWKDFEVHVDRSDWIAARHALAGILELQRDDAFALLQMSYIESLHGSYRLARQFTLDACRAGSADPGVLNDLCNRLRTFNEAWVLREMIANAVLAPGVPASLMVSFAGQFGNLNDSQSAITLLDRAKIQFPSHADVLIARAGALIHLGRFDEAETELVQALASSPANAYGHWLLSRLRKQSKDSNHVARLEQLLRVTKQPGGIALLAFALHKELDDLNDHARAWKALAQGCQAKRANSGYRPSESEHLVSQLIAFPVTPALAEPTHASEGRSPIFIVGMHRSGTTLLEQLLSGHGEVNAIGELYDFTSQMRYATDHHCKGVLDATIVERAKHIDFREVGHRYLAGMEWRLGKERCFTDKLPSNFLNIGFICRALPEARILHMVRDPVETCFSNLRELFSEANAYSYDQIELADYFLQYQRLMRHWHAAYPGRVLDVDYAELTRDPQRVMEGVTRFCGLQFMPDMLELEARTRGVSTASAIQVRDRVIARDKPKWQPYAEYLRPLIDRLQSKQAVAS